MKKIVSVLLLLICLCGCGGEKLTLDNYDNYLEIEIPYKGNMYDTKNGFKYYDSVYGTINVLGASTNYDYENVELVIKISVTATWEEIANKIAFPTGSEQRVYSEDYHIKLNIAGNNSTDFSIYMTGYFEGKNVDSRDIKMRDYPVDYEVSYSVESISGTVKKS